MGCQPVEDVGRDGFPAKGPREADYNADWNRVQKHYEKAVHCGVEAPFGGRSAPFQEEGNGHGDHREDAGCQEHQEAPEDGFKDEAPEAAAGGGRCPFHLKGCLKIGRRKAVSLVAGLPFYGHINVAGALLKGLDALDYYHGGLAGAYLQAEDVVVFLIHPGGDFCGSNGLYGVSRNGKHRRVGTKFVFLKVVDMPAGLDTGHGLYLIDVLLHLFGAHLPFHGVLWLRLYGCNEGQ